MPEHGEEVKESEIKVLESKDFETSDFKPLYDRDDSPQPIRQSYPTHLHLEKSNFPELEQESPGDDVMLVIKGTVESVDKSCVHLKLAYASVVHGKELTTKARNALPSSAFALPGRRFPIPDAAHARNALARVSQHGTPEEKAKVRAAVHRKFPSIGMADKNKARREVFGR